MTGRRWVTRIMKIVLIICSNLVSAVMVVYVIFSLHAQEFSLKLVLPAYPTINIKGAENVDRKTLIKVIDALNGQYEFKENVYKEALQERKLIIHILTITLVSIVAILSIFLIVLSRRSHVKGNPITQPTIRADGV